MVASDDPAVLVDAAAGDDAAVYRFGDEGLIATVDFFTPVVDDAFDFGRIAAANALSDVYAMGGRPLFALSLVAFPRRLLGEGVLEEIVRGAGVVAREAGVAIVGGHSIDDEEPKFGLCVIGRVDPARMTTNAGARPGDALVLTKPIGTGVVSTAIKAGAADAAVVDAAVRSMSALNREAAEAVARAGAQAATDVTGYGLIGHLSKMAAASGVSTRVRASAVPLLPGAAELARAGHVPGGTHRNLEDFAGSVAWADDVDPVTRTLLADAQTSGGLLVALPAERADALVEELGRVGGGAAAVVGTVEAVEGGAQAAGEERAHVVRVRVSL